MRPIFLFFDISFLRVLFTAITTALQLQTASFEVSFFKVISYFLFSIPAVEEFQFYFSGEKKSGRKEERETFELDSIESESEGKRLA